MSAKKNPEEFYKKLKEQLADTSTWPSEYLYKFIIPSENKKIAKLEQLFDNMGAVIETKTSSKGKYTSVSVNVKMNSPEAVVEKYIEVGKKIEGVMSL
ncbi:DUF493 family protein [Mesonia maritima]|uniref:DUF493 domain-containing protein n=1 Tax=Mesonia maritima TaxID=1793873 RepID=A0ABU1K610_9FLAO|nr:DUF493 family protein [Mesonia maritima]MDR6301051.1 hypothetical protein [Mesonia maritima]